MGIFRFDAERPDRRVRGEAEARAAEGDRLEHPGRRRASCNPSPDKPFVASMGIYVFTRDVLLEALERHAGVDFGHEIIPAALGNRRVNAYLFRGYWQDVGTVESFYDANIMLTRRDAPLQLLRPAAAGLHAAALPARRRASTAARVDEAVIAEGVLPRAQPRSSQSIVGIRTRVGRGCRIIALGPARRRLLRERRRRAVARRRRAGAGHRRRLGARPRDRGQERAHRRGRPADQRSRRARTPTATATTSATASSSCPSGASSEKAPWRSDAVK